jgi:hypothetical protein
MAGTERAGQHYPKASGHVVEGKSPMQWNRELISLAMQPKEHV